MRIRNVVLYVAAVLVSIAFAFVIATIVFLASEKLPWKRLPDWVILAINVAPPLAGGALASWVAARLASSRGWFRATLDGHAERMLIAYALSLLISVTIISNWRNGEFGLWRQLIEWPLMALIGLIVVDAILTVRLRGQSVADT